MERISPNMREAPIDFEWRRDNLAEWAEKLCLIHQFGSRDLLNLAWDPPRAGHHTLQSLEEDYGPGLIDLHVAGVIGVHQDKGDAGISGSAVPVSTLVAEPFLPLLFV